MNSKYDFSHFIEELGKLEIVLTDQQLEQFEKYYEMLIEKNKVMNLTAITEFDEVIEKHFLDSINICHLLDLQSEIRLLDLGTGAGFPGIPLKIVFPKLNVVLADSLNKRILFLKDVIQKLGLKDIEAIHGRAEELARQPEYRENFDLCVSRAVANLSTLSEYCIPFVKEGGKFVSYKSGNCEEEINDSKKAVQLLGGKITKVDKFELGEASRSFVVIDKVKTTAKRFPRKAGTPSKEPLQ